MDTGLQLREVMERAGQWLLRNQDPSGGWAERPGKIPSALNTAESIIALIDAGLAKAGDKPIQEAMGFLLKHKRCEAGPDHGAWPREYQAEGGSPVRMIPDILRTAFAIEALIKAGRAVDAEPVKESVQWLIASQNTGDIDHGWGYRRNVASSITATCYALLALLEAHRAGAAQCKQPIERGLAYLVDRCHNDDGSFGTQGPLLAVHTVCAALVLQAARRQELGSVRSVNCEKAALEWLRRNPDSANRLVEEQIQIDAQPGGAGNYGFLFMTDSLVLRALMGSDHVEHHHSEQATTALLTLKDRWDNSGGGFYGPRVFSWSTAKALSALTATRVQEFPERKPEREPGFTVGQIVMVAFTLLLLGSVLYLTILKSFELLHAVFFSVLILALLLVSRFIGEKTFAELFNGLVGALGGKKKKEP